MRCASLTKDGKQCRNNAIPGSKWCYLASHGGRKASIWARIINRIQNHWVITLLTAVGAVAAVIAIVPLFTPNLSVIPGDNPHDPLQTDFIFKNNGYFTLSDVRPVVEGFVDVPKGVIDHQPGRGHIRASQLEKPFLLEDIPPGQSRTLRPIFPIPLKRDQWKSIFACIGVSVRTFPFGENKLPPYCFSLGSEKGLDHWVERPPYKGRLENPPASSSLDRFYFLVERDGIKLLYSSEVGRGQGTWR